MTAVHAYKRGQLKEAMRALAEEASRVAADGYVLVHYQVVESESAVTAAYRRQKSAPVSDASLVGE